MEILRKVTAQGIFITALFFILFGRSFSGLIIFNQRLLGELIVGLLIITSGIIFISPSRITSKINLPSRAIFVYKILIFAFLLNFIAYSSSFSNLYVFRTSSYIWYISFLFICIYIFEDYHITQKQLITNSFALFILYILSTTYFPDFLRSFFVSNADKFDFVKGSDLLLSFVFVNFLNKKYSKNKRTAFYYLIVISGIFLPLMIYMSKGAFLPAVFYISVEIFISRKIIFNNKLFTIFIFSFSVLFFTLSTFQVWGGLSFTRDNINNAIESDDNFPSAFQEAFVEQLERNVENKRTIDAFFSFYTFENRLYSTDLQLNWRLQIWQDVYFDLIKEQKLIQGYGNNTIIPAMDDDKRTGMDNLNENVHNFMINILARGGLIQLSIFIVFFYLIIKWYILKSNSLDILHFVAPVALTSFFDASFESVRFPFIFYLGLAIILSHKKDKKYINIR